jgi:hypothetical protein
MHPGEESKFQASMGYSDSLSQFFFFFKDLFGSSNIKDCIKMCLPEHLFISGEF